jgi:hypothetical protein
VEQKEKDFEEA